MLAIDDLSMMTGYEIRRAVATEEDVDALLGRLGRLDAAVEEIEEEEEDAVIELRESAEDAPVVKLVRSIVADAVERGASDIHFDPRTSSMRVRFRVDGVVSDTTTVRERDGRRPRLAREDHGRPRHRREAAFPRTAASA